MNTRQSDDKIIAILVGNFFLSHFLKENCKNMASNGLKLIQINLNGLKWIEMDWNGLKWIEMDWNGSKWIEMDWNGLKQIEMDWNGLKWIEIDWNGKEATINRALDGSTYPS